MKRSKSYLAKLFGIVVLMLAILIVTACTTTPASPTPSSTPSPTPAPQYTINVSTKSGLGTFLVDGKGMTLYWTTRDAVGKSNITGTTLVNWPAFYPASDVVPASLKMSDLGSITRDDGTKQCTYKGWPLYYYINDKAPGDTLGQGLANVWFVINPTASAPAAPVSSPTPTPTTTPNY
jgi:predicted lipoprotein with Yx(FWY)xxD motif